MEQEQIIYGIHAIEELLQNRITSIDHIYFDQSKKSTALFNLMKTCRKERLSYNLIPEARLSHLAGTTKHQGVVAQCSVLPYRSIERYRKSFQHRAKSHYADPASVEDPGNLGAIIRPVQHLTLMRCFWNVKNCTAQCISSKKRCRECWNM
jgi:23S rRNA (guanosine2251-2'-O)-methyltransferase